MSLLEIPLHLPQELDPSVEHLRDLLQGCGTMLQEMIDQLPFKVIRYRPHHDASPFLQEPIPLVHEVYPLLIQILHLPVQFTDAHGDFLQV